MPLKEILSLTPSGLRGHAELVKSYNMVPQFAYDSKTGWNRNGALDFTRDLMCNGVSLQGKETDEIEQFIFSQVDGGTSAEPSMLSRVMVSPVAAQFCEGALATIVGQQILLKSNPFDVEHKTLAMGNTKRTVPVPLDRMQLTTPHGQILNWQTDQQHCTKNSVLHFRFIKIEGIETSFLAIKQGSATLAFISSEEYLDWVKHFSKKTPLPFEVEPLVTVHATVELNEGYTERSQRAVFFEYTNVNIILHYPDLLGFRHVRETIERPVVNQDIVKAGYIPSANAEGMLSYQPSAIRTSVYYSELNAGVVPFSALEVDRDDSHYRLDRVDSRDDNEAIATIRRSMKMKPSILSQRAIVVERENEYGAAFLSLQAKRLQEKLVELIAQKRFLETSRAQLISTKNRLFVELTQLESAVDVLEIVEDPIKSFKIKSASANKLTKEQFLAAYALLFFPPAMHRDYTSQLGQHLKDHHVFASEYAKRQSTMQLLKSLCFYELSQEAEPNKINKSKHRIYEIVGGKLLTEPFELRSNKSIQDQLPLFHRLIYTAKHDAQRHLSKALVQSGMQQLENPLPQSVEIIVPLLYTNTEQMTVDSVLICFEHHSNTLPLLGEEMEFKINLFSPAIKSNSVLHRFFHGDDSKKTFLEVQKLLCSRIAEMFRENKGHKFQCEYHNISYESALFDKSIALLDILTNYLRGLPLTGEHNCQEVRREVCVYLKFIAEIPQTDSVLICEENNQWISIQVRQQLFEGRPVTLQLKTLNEQVDALKEAISEQEKIFANLDKKIRTCLHQTQDACEITQHAPTASATSLKAIERVADLEMEVVDLQAERLSLLTQMQALKAQLSTFKSPAKNPVTEASSSAKTGATKGSVSSVSSVSDKMSASFLMAELKSKIENDAKHKAEEKTDASPSLK